MTPNDTTEVIALAVNICLKVMIPAALAAIIVGLAIAILQALTQIQESTLSFFPKVLALLLVVSIGSGAMLNQLNVLMGNMIEKIENINK